MSYIGSAATPLPVAFSGVRTQSFNGTGSQTAFTLSRAVSAVTDIEVVVNNVQQSPYDSSYNISGATLTFSEAPSSGTNNIYVIFRDQPVGSLTDPTSVKKVGDTMTGDLVLDNGFADGAQVILKSAGNTDWNIDNYSGALRFYNGSTVRAQIDASGRLTLPYQPVFSAKFSGSATQSGNLSPIKYDTIYSNVGSFYSPSTGVFTAQVAGTYLALVQSLNNNVPGYYAMQILMAGGIVANSWSNAGGAGTSVQSMVVLQAAKYLNVGDTAYVNMQMDKASNYMAETYNIFTVIKVA